MHNYFFHLFMTENMLFCFYNINICSLFYICLRFFYFLLYLYIYIYIYIYSSYDTVYFDMRPIFADLTPSGIGD